MRFNKKRGWTLFNRPAPDKEDTMIPDEAVLAVQEPLPSEVEMEEESMSAPVDEPIQLSGDPIQQLFSTLGKFNRHMSQAQHSPDRGEWAENCMNELATGLEIAIACHWTPVKDALIDTARILHSYDCVGRRRDAIPFLNNSYEILSLMVGDLIVDKVRSGVIQKWKDLYGKTVDELKVAGIPLAEDEEEIEVEMEETDTVDSLSEDDTEPDFSAGMEEDIPAKEQEAPVVPTAMLREEKGGHRKSAERRAGNDDEIPFELPPLSEPEDVLEDGPDEYAEEPVASGSILAFPGNVIDKREAVSDDTDADNEYEDTADEVLPESEEEPVMELEEVLTETPPETGRPATEASLFDVVEETGEETAPEPTGGIEEAESDDGTDADVDEDPEEPLVEEEEPVVAGSETDTDIVDDTDTVTEDAIASTPETEEVQAVLDLDAPADAGTPEHLLRQAQAAMNKGDVRGARSVALELALVMARIEFEQAQEAVAGAEQSLVDNAQAIKAAQDLVEEAELHLLQVEETLATRDGESSACRDQITGMDEELQQFQVELNEIDAEIEALQRRRAEQVNRMENKRVEREDALNSESRLQTEMESLRENVDAIRQDLESLREDKRRQIENKREIEVSICTAREEAESRRLSLAAIEHTLAPRAPAAVPQPGEGELL